MTCPVHRGQPVEDLDGRGIETLKVSALKIMFASGDIAVNMWWPQTRKLRIAMATLDNAMKR
jgi:hypothetical protein